MGHSNVVWPFATNVLLAGLRKYLVAPTLQLIQIHPMQRPAILFGTHGENLGQYQLRLFSAEINLDGATHHLALLLKEFSTSQGKTGEYYFYRFLAQHLPILTPLVIAGDDVQGWLVMLAPSNLRSPQAWTVDDYREGVDNLARLHDFYWGLFQDLDTFSNLKHPLDSGYNVLVKQIQDAIQRLTQNCPYPELATPHYLALFDWLIKHIHGIAQVLKQEPFTLLHGNYWPDNIARPLDGNQTVANWHQAAIGPAILDAVMFAQQTNTHLNPLFPVKAALERYKVQMADRQQKPLWTHEQWNLLWDYGLLWLLMAEELTWVVTLSPQDYSRWHTQMERVWFDPAVKILENRFGMTLP